LHKQFRRGGRPSAVKGVKPKTLKPQEQENFGASPLQETKTYYFIPLSRKIFNFEESKAANS